MTWTVFHRKYKYGGHINLYFEVCITPKKMGNKKCKINIKQVNEKNVKYNLNTSW